MILWTLLCLMSMAVTGTMSDEFVQLSESMGGAHGFNFSDQAAVVAGQTIGSITIHAGKHIGGIELEVAGPNATTFSHGGNRGQPKTLELDPNEYITSMEAHWGERNGHTQIFYLNISTSAGNSIAGGSMTDDKKTVTAPKGFQLGGFFGRSGGEIDSLGAIWTRIAADAPLESSDEAASEESAPEISFEDSVQLSESFGGPHGREFSDESAAASGQTVASITIRGMKRVDAVALELTAPTALNFTHGGNGGQPNTLKLGSDEYITSMEVHWDKQKARTRVFYLRFNTSAGNSVSAGSMTEAKATVTAPEGFQLGGFFGRATEEIDQLGAIWTSIKAISVPTPPEGSSDKSAEGSSNESAEGSSEESAEGSSEESAEGSSEGSAEGSSEESAEGSAEGSSEESAEGSADESAEGSSDESAEGSSDESAEGSSDESAEGSSEESAEGSSDESEEEPSGSVQPANITLIPSSPKIKRGKVLSKSFGGPHGKQFSDRTAAASGGKIASLTIRGAERIDGITLEVSAPKAQTLTHGGTGGRPSTLVLAEGEYITSMEIHWGQKNEKTRIFYLKFSTNANKSISAGSQTDERGTVIAPEGYQLGGFFGRDGDEIDNLGVIWTSIEAIEEEELDDIPADQDIVLSELCGGPHGLAFSDINKIKLEQSISTISIRAVKRLDAINLRVTKPAHVLMNHGGDGGIEEALSLSRDEHITSVEIHWGKKDDHTRVFYVNFTTSAGNVLFGGTPTQERKTLIAPKNFRLGGFHGRAETGVDQLGVIWTRINATDIELTNPDGMGNGTYGTTIRNWVGANVLKSSDTACYRKTLSFNSTNICPSGYGKEDLNCVAQCPMSYPVACGLECIPQNDDCTLAALTKVGSVIVVALNLATANIVGEIVAVVKVAKWGILCAANIIGVIQSLIFFLRYRQTTAPQGDVEQLLTVAYQADVVLVDIPVAVCVCLNLPVPRNLVFAGMVMSVVQGIVKQVITNGDEILKMGANVINLILGHVNTTVTVDELQDLIDKNSTCGWALKSLTDRLIFAINDIRNKTPDADPNDVRVTVYESPIVLDYIPTVTNNCMGELLSNKTMDAAYQTRDLIRRTFAVIVDQLIEKGTTDWGKDVAENEFMLEAANMGLMGLSLVDPTGIAYMGAQFVQPICGPTAYLGEIDDGTLVDALGLTTVDEAFVGSYGSWLKSGDGVVRLIFESVDNKDVTVVIHSGGDKFAKVDVGAGAVVVWEAMLPELQDKNMYLDRWRPGIFGLPGKGGGSLLLWVPRSSHGGHLTMHVRINVS